ARSPDGGRLLLRQDPVERAARLVQDLAGLLDLLVVPGRRDLVDGRGHLPDLAAELHTAFADLVTEACPGLAQFLPVLVEVRLAVVGQDVSLAAVVVLGADEPLVLELRQGRIYRPRARSPDALAPAFDLLHQPVTAERLLGEDQQHRR